jgi:hypothetical protein
MKIIHKSTGYPYEVHLNIKEWPHPDYNWHERPIYKWVKNNCGAHVFSPEGWVLLLRESDLIQFQLTWSQS